MSTESTLLSQDQLNALPGTGGVAGGISFLILGSVIMVLSGDIWQRMYSAKTQKDLNIGLAGAAIVIIVFGIVISSIGVWAKTNFPGIAPESAFIYGIQNIIPDALLSIGLLVVLSTIMSTADTIIFAMSMNLSLNSFSITKN